MFLGFTLPGCRVWQHPVESKKGSLEFRRIWGLGCRVLGDSVQGGQARKAQTRNQSFGRWGLEPAPMLLVARSTAPSGLMDFRRSGLRCRVTVSASRF